MDSDTEMQKVARSLSKKLPTKTYNLTPSDEFARQKEKGGPCPSCASLQAQMWELEDALVEVLQQFRNTSTCYRKDPNMPTTKAVLRLLERRRIKIVKETEFYYKIRFLPRPKKPAEREGEE